jgi:ceramide glucosyltransferase
MLITALKLLCTGATLAACAFYLLSMLAAMRFFRGTTTHQASELGPVSILIPLCGADAGAYESYEAFCHQDYSVYQIVFGVRDPLDAAVPIVRRLMANFPDRDITLVICPDTIGANLKVSNLYNMLAYAKHEWIVIVDSDIRVGTAYLRNIMPLLADQRIGLVTCLYRAAQAPAFAARLEAIGITADFVPGVLAAWLLEGMHFALGSTMALTRTTLKAIGGFQAIGDYLADDFILGHLIARAGYEVCLARHVVGVVVAPMGFYDMLKHQLRWSRSMRFSRPVGYLGAVLTHGTALALLNLLVHHRAVPSLVLFGVALSIRLGMAWLIGVHWLDDRVLQESFWLLPLRDLLNFGIWCLGLFGKRVEWRGRLLEIIDDGKIVQVR